jgi:hypothetical protein
MSEVGGTEVNPHKFQNALIALDAGGEDALLRGLHRYFTDREEVMAAQILLPQTPQGMLYPSYQYQLSVFLSALTYISETGVRGWRFYTGKARTPGRLRYGVVNTVMLLSQAYKELIQYNACDENNWEVVNDLFLLSNACGQFGMSYQDMSCRVDEAHMECPIKADMEQVAMANTGWFRAPELLMCCPRLKFQITGFWDCNLGREDNVDAYTNARDRVEVEGSCWWGRGVMATHQATPVPTLV